MNEKTFFENYLESLKDDFEFKLETLSLDLTEKILEIMEEKGITRSELAEMLNVNKASISRLLNHGSNITIKRLLAIAEALENDIDISFRDKHEDTVTYPIYNKTANFCFKDQAADFYGIDKSEIDVPVFEEKNYA